MAIGKRWSKTGRWGREEGGVEESRWMRLEVGRDVRRVRLEVGRGVRLDVERDMRRVGLGGTGGGERCKEGGEGWREM